MSEFEAWLEFRRGENPREPRLICTECGRRAEGNCSWTDGSGEICDKCAASQNTETA